MKSRIFALTAALLIAGPALAGEAVATFAGGCFWCMEPPYDKVEGVKSTISGYMGGHVRNPTYEQVSRKKTGHAEVVQVTYDPDVVTYETLLDIYWHNIDPLDAGGQFCDRGDSYRTEIFFHTPEQAAAARASRERVQARFEEPVATAISEAGEFYPAEDYHQDYYEKNPVRYKYYRWRCGRDERLQQLWGEESGG